MNPIRTSIERPIAVIAAVLMVVMFGMVALETIPSSWPRTSTGP